MTTVLQEILANTIVGERFTSIELTDRIYPQLPYTDRETKRNKIGNLIRREARNWGTFREVGRTPTTHGHYEAIIWERVE